MISHSIKYRKSSESERKCIIVILTFFSETISDTFSFYSYDMGSGASQISIHIDEEQPIMAGKQLTGTVMFNNTSGKSRKFQHIYAVFIGEVIYWAEHSTDDGHYEMTHREAFFYQLINLENKPVRR